MRIVANARGAQPTRAIIRIVVCLRTIISSSPSRLAGYNSSISIQGLCRERRLKCDQSRNDRFSVTRERERERERERQAEKFSQADEYS